eukprot:TRINITY_DN10160_c0_g1_i1.p1 TRINITY_DN10160_c0_g1~~TRINITY_DN10160_c0_g1_i1.p1  ORF type:complete len:193 (-),score=60.74 TRINITY_DN10160_c0_g1_i1:44-622(-)
MFWFLWFFFFFSSRRRHTRCREVSWARRCVQETGTWVEITAEKVFKVMAGDDQESKINYTASLEQLVDAYRSFAGDVDGSFVAVFTDKIFRLRAETEFSMRVWLKLLRPIHQKAHLEPHPSESSTFIPMHEYIYNNKEAWHSKLPKEERDNHIKESTNYLFELLDYFQLKRQSQLMAEAFKAITQQPAPPNN